MRLVNAKIHIIHVGPMTNKGTQALLKSDDFALREILGREVELSVSTADMDGVKRLNLPLSTVIVPTIIDLPYVIADNLAMRLHLPRRSIGYKILSLYSLFLMFCETALLVLSACFARVKLPLFYRRNVLKHMIDSDVVVSCSDENFKETASMLPLNLYWAITWWTMLFERMMEVSVAKFFKKPVVMFPNSVGPFRTKIGLLMSKLAINNFDSIIVREAVSFKMLKRMGVAPKMSLTSDAALLFSPDPLVPVQRFNPDSIGVSIGVYSQSLSERSFQDFLSQSAEALDQIVEQHDVNVCFFPHYISGFERDDLDVSKMILNKMKRNDRAQVYKIDSLDEFKKSIEQMKLLISSKMHPMVLGTSGYVPTVCIAYDHKQTGFLGDLGLEECLIPIKDMSSQLIVSKVGLVLERRAEIIQLLRKRVPLLQNDVKSAMRNSLKPFIKQIGQD
jgi:polysaccharide pyruvyl transferase WcaK-like protein